MLSGLSALVGFVPYIMVFFVMRDVIGAVAAKEAVNAAVLARYGLWAVGSAAAGFVLYYAALMLSHATAFTIQENLSIRMTKSHTELLERKGLYASMWDNFQKGIEWKV